MKLFHEVSSENNIARLLQMALYITCARILNYNRSSEVILERTLSPFVNLGKIIKKIIPKLGIQKVKYNKIFSLYNLFPNNFE